MTCPTDCVDEDGDGYGTGTGCMGTDCNDMDRAVNPGAMEVCNGKDDDCDNQEDECEGDMQACDPNRRQCQGMLQADCQQTANCITGLLCENGKCLGGVGVGCGSGEDCAQTFECNRNTGVCQVDPNYDVCTEELMCDQNNQFCLRDQARCVACLDSFDCPGIEFCAGYTCSEMPYREFISDDETTDILDMARWFADCIIGTGNDNIEICGVIDGEQLETALNDDQVTDWICDDATEADFEGGETDLEAAKGVAGCGLFNDRDLDWDDPLRPGVYWEYCMWTLPPAIFFDEKNVVVGKCVDFPIE
jgi:hypothetical protein